MRCHRFAKLSRFTGVSFLVLFLTAALSGCGGSDESVRLKRAHILLEVYGTERLGLDMETAVTKTVQALRQQMDDLEFRNVTVEPMGGNRILLDIPLEGEADPQAIIETTGIESHIEFFLVKSHHEAIDILVAADKSIPMEALPEEFENTSHPLLDFLLDSQLYLPTGGVPISADDVDRFESFADATGLDTLLPPDTRLVLSSEDEMMSPDTKGRILYVADREPALTSYHIARAETAPDHDRPDRHIVLLKFNEEGTRIFSDLTGNNIGRHVAFVFDGRVILAPRINDRIPTGDAAISGSFTLEEAERFVIILNARKKMAPFRVIETSIIETEIIE